MSKESDYQARMEALGIWDPAFSGAVHDLCMMERDQAKTRTALRKAVETGADPATLSEMLMEQHEAIQKMREALCLTPKALKRVQPDFGTTAPAPASDNITPLTMLDKVRKRREA